LRNWSCPVLLAHSLLPNPTQSAHSSVLPANTACRHSASQHSTACLQVVPRACPALLAHNPVLPTDGAQPSSAHSLQPTAQSARRCLPSTVYNLRPVLLSSPAPPQHSLPAGACPALSSTAHTIQASLYPYYHNTACQLHDCTASATTA